MPGITSFVRQTPGSSPTASDTLVLRTTFTEDVQNVDTADFAVNGTTTATVSNVSAVSASVYDVTISGGDLASFDGTVGLNLAASPAITDLSSNSLPTGEPATDETYTVDNTVPSVSSISTADSNPTNAASVDFTVAFDGNVNNVDTTDFTLTTTGDAAGTIASVSAATGSSITVTVNSITGDGTLRLDLNSSSTGITDDTGNAIAAGYTGGQAYTIDNTAPGITSFVRQTPGSSPTASDTLVLRTTFTEDVQNVDTADFAVNGTTTATVSNVSAVSASVYDVTISGGDLASFDGTVGLNLAASPAITDLSSNSLPTGEPATDETYTVDNTVPSVNSISTADSNPTNAASVDFTVAFDGNVNNVDTTDFALTTTGDVAGTIASVSAATGSSITVTVNSITCDGTLRLDLNSASTGITDDASNAISGGYTSGQAYTIDNTVPAVASIIRADSTPTNATSVDFTVTFTGIVTGIDTGDFVLTTTSSPGGSIASVSAASGTSVTVTVNSVAGDGTIRLDLVDDDSITDNASNALGGAGNNNGDYTSGESYTIFSNQAPTITSNPSTSLDEDDTVTFTSNSFNYNDGDTDPLSKIQVTNITSNGSLWVDTDSGGTINNAESALSNNDEVTTGNLSKLTYKPTSNYNGSDSFQYKVNDGTEYSASAGTMTVTINAVNDAPVLSAGGTLAYNENASAAVIDAGIALSDADDTQIAGGSVALSSGRTTGDVLAVATGSTNITASYVPGTGVLTLSGTDTIANYLSILQAVTFASSSDDPTSTSASRTITFSVTDADSDGAGAETSTATSTINITPANDAPALSAGGTLAYTENGSAAVIDGGVALSDADDSQIASGSVTISSGWTIGDVLAVATGSTNITASYAPGTGVLTLSGTDTIANYLSILQAVTFASSSDDPTSTSASRTITFSVTDADSDGAGAETSTATSTINITPANDAPALSAGGTLAYNENASVAVIDAGIALSDADDTQIAGGSVALSSGRTTGDVLAVATGSTNITASYVPGTGVLTLSGTDTIANYLSILQAVTFASSSDDPTSTSTSRTITFSVTDADSESAGAETSTATSTINITPANDAPALSAGGTLAYTENDSATVIDAGVALSDADDTEIAGGSVTISSGWTTGDVLAVATGSTNITASYSPGTGVLTLSGTDTIANYLSILQAVTFASSSDDPTSTSASRTITFSVTDADSDGAGAETSTATSTINITPANDAPALSAGGTLAYTENGSAAVIDGGVALSDADDTQIASGSVTISSGWTTGDVLAVATGSTNITASYSPGTGVLTLSGTDTIANYLSILQAVTFASSSDDPTSTSASRTITFSVTDADSDGAGAETSTATSTINITPANDAPIAIADTAVVTENAAVTTTSVLDNDTDADTNDTIIVSAVNGSTSDVGNQISLSSGAVLTLSSDGTFIYDPNGKYESLDAGDSTTDSFTYTAKDSNGAISTVTVVITITGVNDPPPATAMAFT